MRGDADRLTLLAGLARNRDTAACGFPTFPCLGVLLLRAAAAALLRASKPCQSSRTLALSLPENWPALANSGLSPLVYVVAALALALSLALALDVLDLIPRPLLSTWAALRVYAETLVLGIFALKLFVGAITRGAYSDAFALAVLIAFARRGLAPRAAPAKAPAPAPAAATPARPARASTSPGRGSSPVDPSKLRPGAAQQIALAPRPGRQAAEEQAGVGANVRGGVRVTSAVRAYTLPRSYSK